MQTEKKLQLRTLHWTCVPLVFYVVQCCFSNYISTAGFHDVRKSMCMWKSCAQLVNCKWMFLKIWKYYQWNPISRPYLFTEWEYNNWGVPSGFCVTLHCWWHRFPIATRQLKSFWTTHTHTRRAWKDCFLLGNQVEIPR